MSYEFNRRIVGSRDAENVAQALIFLKHGSTHSVEVWNCVHQRDGFVIFADLFPHEDAEGVAPAQVVAFIRRTDAALVWCNTTTVES